MLLAFVAYKTQFHGRVSALTDMLIDLRMLRLHGERLADIAKTEPEPDHVRPLANVRFEPSIELRDLYFATASKIRGSWKGVDLRDRAGRIRGDRRAIGLRQDHLAEDHGQSAASTVG